MSYKRSAVAYRHAASFAKNCAIVSIGIYAGAFAGDGNLICCIYGRVVGSRGFHDVCAALDGEVVARVKRRIAGADIVGAAVDGQVAPGINAVHFSGSLDLQGGAGIGFDDHIAIGVYAGRSCRHAVLALEYDCCSTCLCSILESDFYAAFQSSVLDRERCRFHVKRCLTLAASDGIIWIV